MNTSCNTIFITLFILALLVLSVISLTSITPIDGYWICTLLITIIYMLYAIMRVCIEDYEGCQSFIFIIIAFTPIIWCIYGLTTTTPIDELLHIILTAYVILYVIIFLEMINQCTSVSKIQDITDEP